jgi:hypothetical protein
MDFIVYSNKLENLKEMDKFLGAFDQPKLNQEDINHLDRSIAVNEIEAVIKSLLTKKSPGLDGFKKIIHYDQVGFISGMQGWFSIFKWVNVILHINR